MNIQGRGSPDVNSPSPRRHHKCQDLEHVLRLPPTRKKERRASQGQFLPNQAKPSRNHPGRGRRGMKRSHGRSGLSCPESGRASLGGYSCPHSLDGAHSLCWLHGHLLHIWAVVWAPASWISFHALCTASVSLLVSNTALGPGQQKGPVPGSVPLLCPASAFQHTQDTRYPEKIDMAPSSFIVNAVEYPCSCTCRCRGLTT